MYVDVSLVGTLRSEQNHCFSSPSTSSGNKFRTAGDSRRPTEYNRTFKLPVIELRSTPGSSKTDVRFCLNGHFVEVGFVLFPPKKILQHPDVKDCFSQTPTSIP